MWSYAKRISNSVWLWIAIVAAITLLMGYELRKAEERLTHVKSLYRNKNDVAFLFLLKKTPSYVPLADTLEALSEVDDKEDPAEVQQRIEKAKELSDNWFQDILVLIEFSDDYTIDADPQYMLNYSIMNSTKQNDMFVLAYQANIRRVAHKISYDFWKVKPKRIPRETRNTLRLLAEEVRLLDDTLAGLRETAARTGFRPELEPMYDESLKKQLLDQLKPHLERLKTIQENFLNEEKP